MFSAAPETEISKASGVVDETVARPSTSEASARRRRSSIDVSSLASASSITAPCFSSTPAKSSSGLSRILEKSFAILKLLGSARVEKAGPEAETEIFLQPDAQVGFTLRLEQCM